MNSTAQQEKVEELSHHHDYIGDKFRQSEKRIWLVIFLTLITMTAEIMAGSYYRSMALLADGWHMGSHALALSVAAFAYYFARKHAQNPKYSFGTGKVSSLGGFASAILLGLVALGLIYESGNRLLQPVMIDFDNAILVAVIGLFVNLISAVILAGGRFDHHHMHEAGKDHNLKAAYLHVLSDALTSLAAIFALVMGKIWGVVWMDPVMGIVSSVIILRWGVQLIGQTSGVLLDSDVDVDIVNKVRDVVGKDAPTEIADIHVWRIGPNELASIITVVSTDPQAPDYYKNLLREVPELIHITVEVYKAS